jgi:hypothetical protein
MRRMFAATSTCFQIALLPELHLMWIEPSRQQKSPGTDTEAKGKGMTVQSCHQQGLRGPVSIDSDQ